MFTGSLQENRVTVGVPPPVRQELYETGRDMGMSQAEVIRFVLIQWWETRMAMRGLGRQ